MAKLKGILLPLAMLVVGTAAGAGGGFAANRFLGPAPPPGPKIAEPVAKVFVPAGKILAPIVAADGHLSGYVTFEVQLEIPADATALTESKMPLFLHAINMRTFRSPMASGPDGVLPDLALFRRVLTESAGEAFGPNVIGRIAITSATPA